MRTRALANVSGFVQENIRPEHQVGRIHQAKLSFNTTNKLFIRKNLNLNLKKSIVVAFVWSALVYGNDTRIFGVRETRGWRHLIYFVTVDVESILGTPSPE